MGSTTIRKQYSPDQKMAILKRHLINHENISDICDDIGLHPNQFYKWQAELFSNGSAVFDRKKSVPKASRELKRLKEKNSHIWTKQSNILHVEQKEERRDSTSENKESFISINVPTLPEVSTGSIYKVPVRLINNSSLEISGTLVVSINRGGIFISQLYQRTIKAKSNIGIVVDIPAQSYFGPAKIEFVFQDNTGFIFCKSEKKIQFQ